MFHSSRVSLSTIRIYLTPKVKRIFNNKHSQIMSQKIETNEMISGQLDVVEAKLNELLRKFGYDDDDLWLIRRSAYNDARELAEKAAQHSLEKLRQLDLFSSGASSDSEDQ